MTGIYREMSNDEKKDFRDIGPTKTKDVTTNFLTELAHIRHECTKNKIPFFKKAAMDDFDDYYKKEVQKSTRKNGFLKLEDIQPIKMDWKKYSSTSNIELIEMIVQRDSYASKKQPFEVFVRTFRYKFKGYGAEGVHNISIMEDESDAVKRLKAEYDNKEFNEISRAEKVSQRYDRKNKKKNGIIDSLTGNTDKKDNKEK